MYSRSFFNTKLGRASLASIAAMTAMVVLSAQFNIGANGTGQSAPFASPLADVPALVELA